MQQIPCNLQYGDCVTLILPTGEEYNVVLDEDTPGRLIIICEEFGEDGNTIPLSATAEENVVQVWPTASELV
ncbi:MAG TPA: hypothetical protein VG326_12225 [Tepidisphaeraceae bacterium]|nr:hypothetical protein [Tepidisphaeraceae bacterium]